MDIITIDIAQISEIFEDIVGVAPIAGLDTQPDDVEGWDSLGHVRLVHALEQELGCSMPMEALVIGLSLGDLLAAAGVLVGP